jgi:hypothetical protein
MSTPIQTTELTAVNMMLSSIGERPVTNLDETQRVDVLRAVSTLNEINVLVQSRGWWFNEEANVEVTPNGAGEYILEESAIKVDLSSPSVDNYVKRGNKLYNKDTRLFTGNTDTIKIDFVSLLEFDDCPETFKTYVARRAGVVYQTRSVGSPTLYEFTERDAQEAWGTLQMEELENVDTNLTFAPGIRDAVYNR